MAFGTNAVFADLQLFPYPIDQFGFNEAFDAIEDLFKRTDMVVKDQLQRLCNFTDKQWMLASAPDFATTQELDEFGTPNPQKIEAGAQIGFPCRKFGAGWQVTFTARNLMLGKELAAMAAATATADLRRVQNRIRTALYTPTNYLFWDKLFDRKQQFQLPVKALANADGFPIPIGPNGEVFNASTHNHYQGTVGSSVAQSDYDLLITNVMEHHNSGQVYLGINQADVSFVQGFTIANGLDRFNPLVDVRVVQALSQYYAEGGLDVNNLYNRQIGLYRGAQVWVLPWAIAGYPVCWQGVDDKPLMVRELPNDMKGLHLVDDGTIHPLFAKVYEHNFDIGVFNRIGAAVLDTLNQTSYVAPTIPAA